MKYAVDRYGVGVEKEVRADIFYNKYIPQRNSRFFCPECGERVFWSSRGGALPDRFSHYKKTEYTPECDRRVDGYSEMNLYERVGLPVYLNVRLDTQFCLNIGFPAVGGQMLLEAFQQSVQVFVTGADCQRKIPVDTVHFVEDHLTLIPINFIPDAGKNYTVAIAPDERAGKLREKWPAYADGFGYGGAIFTYGETGGKKIRKGDSVSPDRQYYVVARRFNPPPEIDFTGIGEILLNRNTYNVYLITIHVSVQNMDRYQYVKNYLQKQFGVWLLQTAPELIPLWPPMTEQEVMIPVKSNATIYCSVSSGNDEPNVYKYEGCKVSSLPVNNHESGIHTICFSVSSREMTLSVDRKYVGREIDFREKEVIYPKFEYDFSIEKADGKLVAWKDITKRILSEAFVLNANAKMEMYIGSRNKLFRHISVREQRVAVSGRYHSEEIILVTENAVLMYYQAQAANKTDDRKEVLTVNKIRGCCHGEWVPTPCWVAQMLHEWKHAGFVGIFEEVKQIISNGKIPIGLLNILYDSYCAGGCHICHR